jgi:hypothetical protein
MACRQRYNLASPSVEERVGANDQRARLQGGKACKGGFKIVGCAGFDNVEADRLRSRVSLRSPARSASSVNRGALGENSLNSLQ